MQKESILTLKNMVLTAVVSPFQITDKRVSRKHAILEVVDGQVRIKPVT